MDYMEKSAHHPTFRDFWAKEQAINAFLQNTVTNFYISSTVFFKKKLNLQQNVKKIKNF